MSESAAIELARIRSLIRKVYELREAADRLAKQEEYKGGYAIAALSEAHRLALLDLEKERQK